MINQRPNEHLQRSVPFAQRSLRHLGQTLDIAANVVAKQPKNDGQEQGRQVGGEGRAKDLPTNRNIFGDLTIAKICPVCRNCFETGRRDTKYCSGKCKQKAYRARKKKDKE